MLFSPNISIKIYKHPVGRADLEKIKQDYEGNYICFYDERHISGDVSEFGERKVIFTRRYELSNIDLNDGSLYGDFQTIGGYAKGVVKFIFSPSNRNRDLVY